LIDRRIEIAPEASSVDIRSRRESGKDRVFRYEDAPFCWPKFTHGDAVARDDERIPSIEGAHDVAAFVSEFALSDFSLHFLSVAHVLRA